MEDRGADVERAHPEGRLTTAAKARTNRENARRSTGPKSAEGRARASRNATKHGLLAQRVLLEDEPEPEFRHFHLRMIRALAPSGEVEQTLAQRVVASAWRLRRFERIEAMMLESGRRDWRGGDAGLGVGFIGLCVNGDAYSKLCRYEAGVERAMYRALHELQRLQAARMGQVVQAPVAVDVDVSTGPESGPVAAQSA